MAWGFDITGSFWKTLRIGASLTAIAALASCQSFSDLGLDEADLRPSSRPVTVDNVRSGRLARIGAAQHPRILASYGGEYQNPKLERMVAGIVGRLVTVSDNPSQTYQVSILNTPLVNAFALPGGYLYVSRGLLALASDSDELAAVIAHEMAHVTANHGIERQRREEEAGLANRVVTDVLSQSDRGRLALIRNQIDLARFSRIQELEADAIGIAAMGEAGFDPYAAADFQRKMAAYGALTARSSGSGTLDFLSTHPSTPQRIELALGHARKFGSRETAPARSKMTYLSGIDGMLFGDAADEGFLRGQVYAHKTLGIRIEFPNGFEVENRPDAVLASRQRDGAAIRFDGVDLQAGTALSNYLASGWVEGLDPTSIRTTTTNGLEAANARAAVGTWKFDITVFRVGSRAYRVLIAVPASGVNIDQLAEDVRSNFRTLSAQESASLRPLRVRTVRANAGDTVLQLSAAMEGIDSPSRFFRAINGLGTTDSIEPSDTYKIVAQ
ncbi:MAG: M48 family metalloprotease [Pseudomonadota bacterium]